MKIQDHRSGNTYIENRSGATEPRTVAARTTCASIERLPRDGSEAEGSSPT
jgi:hypothetical protein